MDVTRGKNITTKILAVIMAVVLWLYVTNEQNPPVETTVTVPLEVRGVTDSFTVVDVPEMVRVKVRGPRSITAGLTPQDIQAFVDLRGAAEGRHSVRIQAAVPTSLEFLEVQPDKLTVRVDAKESRALPVEVRVTGTAVAGTVVTKAVVSPQEVTVHGPKNVVGAVDKVVMPLDLTGKNADFAVRAAPLLLGRDGKPVEGLAVNPDRVTMTVTLGQGVSKKTVDVKPVIFGDPAPGTTMGPIATVPARVEISGDPKVLEKIDEVYTDPVSVAGIGKDTEKEVPLQLKEGVLATQNAVKVRISVGR